MSEPSLVVPEKLRPVLDELSELEPLFHLANDGRVRHELESLKRVTRRATLWRRHPGGWKVVYHQGTVAER